MTPKISLIVLTYNEENNLRACLGSVRGAVSEIIVVDSGSTDRTGDIAGEFGAKFVVHAFKNQAEQFNWALENTGPKGDWILRLDADEYLTEELAEELKGKLPLAPEGVGGFLMKRRVYFLGSWIKHGGYYPSWFLRVFRRGQGESELREMDEHLILTKGSEARLENDFVDDNQNGLSRWMAKHRNYALREAKSYWKEVSFGLTPGGRSPKLAAYYRLPIFLRPFLYFFYRYFLQFGFLDGFGGFMFHILQGFWYRFLIDLNIFKIRNKQ